MLLTAGSLVLLVKNSRYIARQSVQYILYLFCYAQKLIYAFFTPPLLQEDTKEMDGAVTDAVAPTANMDEIHKQVSVA